MAARGFALRRYWVHASFAVQTWLLRRERPYLFILVINDRCNLDCHYCESKNSGLYDLDRSSALDLLRYGAERGHRALVITGGEPMLWESQGATLADVVAAAIRYGFVELVVFTNGTIPLTIPECKYIVTIDGTRETHDAIRRGTYDKILRNVREAKAEVFASITISKTNEDVLEEAVAGIVETGAFKGISFNLLTSTSEVVERLGLTGSRRASAIDRMWKLRCQGNPVMLSRAAYRALRSNAWRRPIQQIELASRQGIFTCCRDVTNPDVCRNCGYSSCVEISQALAGKPTAVLEFLRMP
jgi:Fe-coproporphyrin III synthase